MSNEINFTEFLIFNFTKIDSLLSIFSLYYSSLINSVKLLELEPTLIDLELLY